MMTREREIEDRLAVLSVERADTQSLLRAYDRLGPCWQYERRAAHLAAMDSVPIAVREQPIFVKRAVTPWGLRRYRFCRPFRTLKNRLTFAMKGKVAA